MAKPKLLLPVSLLILVAMACSLPGTGSPTSIEETPTLEPGPSPTPLPPSPPTLVETKPNRGEELPLEGSIWLYFDQVMDHPSVEAGLRFDPPAEHSITWSDAATAQIDVHGAFEQNASYTLHIDTSARAATGLTLEEPIEQVFQTVGDLEVTQVLPQHGAAEVNPDSPITVVFNRPVVPLEIDKQGPDPLRFDPPLPGNGEWVDTSIYIYHAEGQLPGGVLQTVSIDGDFADMTGAVIPEPYSWSFTAALPSIISVQPSFSEQDVPLDASISVVFNQAMDTASVEGAFLLQATDEDDVPGAFSWEDDTTLTFTPAGDLVYGSEYVFWFTAAARAKSGVALDSETVYFFDTVRRPAVLTHNPAQDGVKPYDQDLQIIFNAPMDPASVLEALAITPELEGLSTYWYSYEKSPRTLLEIYGDYKPATSYTLTIDTSAGDPHGTTLTEPFRLDFTTGDLAPQASFARFGYVLAFTQAGTQQMEMNVRNLSRLDFQLFELTLQESFALVESGLYRGVQPQGELLRTWSETFTLERNASEKRAFSLYPTPLEPGTYLLFVDSPQLSGEPLVRLILVREVELVLKTNVEQVMVWAVDLQTGAPISGASVRFLSANGTELERATTDEEGLTLLSFPYGDDPYTRFYIATGEPGEEAFGLTASQWSNGILPYEFGVNFTMSAQEFKTYLYTDRPIYRPGHTVRFRGIMRNVDEARYTIPEAATAEVSMRDPYGEVLSTENLALSAYGTFNGEFDLPESAQPGGYAIRTENAGVFFDVAEYRKPEFVVKVDPSEQQVGADDPLTAVISGEYFFGGVVPKADVQWSVWANPYYVPGVPRSIDWFSFVDFRYPSFGFEPFAQGEGQTDEDGNFEIEIPTELEGQRALRLNVEATLTDASGMPVTGRTTVMLHPATFYFGLSPERYAVRAGDEAVVKLTSIDWYGDPLPNQNAELRVERLVWRQVVGEDGRLTWESEGTLVNQGALSTDDEAVLRFSFVPAQSGTYRVTAQGHDAQGRTSLSETLLWVSGPGAGRWRRPPAGRMTLVPDRESYGPGDTAHVLVPPPFEGTSTALITIERSGILSHEIRQISGAETLLDIPIQELHAPNAVLSVVLVRPADSGQPAQIAVGMVDLEVSAQAFALDVTLTPDREQAGPDEEVTYTLQATDSQGEPVQAEFSLGLADLAALSLADPNSQPPFESFYDKQPLRVRSAASLTISGEVSEQQPQADGIGGGGGGGAEIPSVRSEFPDTAYWNASVVTDEQGQAKITLKLPDSLTTWRMDARGTTLDTRVGAVTTDLVATKELLIRPVTPRFFTAGDAAAVAAVVHNNTQQEIAVEVELTVNGAQIDTEPIQDASIAAAGQQRFDWRLSVHDVDAVDMTFRVSGGGLQDASKPTIGTARDGALPVLKYRVADTAATAGLLVEAGERLELVNLPRSFDATQGSLTTTLDPTLGAALNTALDALENEPYLSTEAVVSRFLPNLAAYRAFQALGLDEPALQDRLERTLDENLLLLRNRQNNDGGWGWWSSSPSNSYITAYVLYGLGQALDAGANVSERMIDEATQFLHAGLTHPDLISSPGVRDRQIFVLYALASVGGGDLSITRQMTEQRELLSLWAKALLAQTLHILAPSSPETGALLSDLETAAVRTATSAHWDDTRLDQWNMGSSVRTTSHALMTLLMIDPDNSIIPGVVRWLLAARAHDGAWRSTHETTWALLALVDWMEASGSLQANYDYALALNGRTLSSGTATPGALLASVEHTTPLEELLPDAPNQLLLERSGGDGTLFYSTHLTVFRSVDYVEASARGLRIQREYFHYDGECGGVENPCTPAPSGSVGEDLLVRLTMVVPSDQYYVAVEDPYPAGTEPIDNRLLTTPSAGPPSNLAEADLNRGGWGGWWFSHVAFGDEKLALFADVLPAGTYQYTYLLHASLAGEYRVLPPSIRAVYLPEIYGHGEGRVYTIQP